MLNFLFSFAIHPRSLMVERMTTNHEVESSSLFVDGFLIIKYLNKFILLNNKMLCIIKNLLLFFLFAITAEIQRDCEIYKNKLTLNFNSISKEKCIKYEDFKNTNNKLKLYITKKSSQLKQLEVCFNDNSETPVFIDNKYTNCTKDFKTNDDISEHIETIYPALIKDLEVKAYYLIIHSKDTNELYIEIKNSEYRYLSGVILGSILGGVLILIIIILIIHRIRAKKKLAKKEKNDDELLNKNKDIGPITSTSAAEKEMQFNPVRPGY